MNHNGSVVDSDTDDENEELNLDMLPQFTPIFLGLQLEFISKIS